MLGTCQKDTGASLKGLNQLNLVQLKYQNKECKTL